MGKNNRKFNFADSKLLEHGEKVAKMLPNDISNFKLFDNTFQETYPSTIIDAITEVMNLKANELLIDEMTEYTQKLNTIMGRCNSVYRTISFFVRKAFPENQAVANQFGANDIERVRKNQSQMVTFMSTLEKVVDKYRSALLTAGCQEMVLLSIPSLTEMLKEANAQQEAFKNGRGIETQTRVEKLNSLYHTLIPLSEMAQIIYADDPAHLDIYIMPKPANSTPTSDDLLTQ